MQTIKNMKKVLTVFIILPPRGGHSLTAVYVCLSNCLPFVLSPAQISICQGAQSVWESETQGQGLTPRVVIKLRVIG